MPGFEVVASFDKCPVCGSDNLFVKSFLKERGITGAGLAIGAQFANLMKPMLVGSAVPALQMTLEACKDCGTVFSSQMMQGELVPNTGVPGSALPKNSRSVN